MGLLCVLLPPRFLVQFESQRPAAASSQRGELRAVILALALGLLALAATPLLAQVQMEAFHWVDFHDPKDAPFVTWVTTTMTAEKWTAIREIGVQWDAALVVTSERKTPQSTPPTDVYTVWSVSLSKHEAQPLLHGVNPRVLNWTTFGGPYQQSPELALIYDDCYGCDATTTSFTTLFYNFAAHGFRSRWMRGDQAAALGSTGTVDGVVRNQVYGLLTEPNGREVLATWNHFDYGKAKPAEDFVFEYSVEPSSGLEQTQALSGKHAEEMMDRLCKADPAQIDPTLAELARGQDSALCRELVQAKTKAKPVRKPTTSPPANNHGQSSPPGAKKR